MNREQANRTILLRLSAFLQGSARLDGEDIEMLIREFGLSLETAARTMLSAMIGLDTDLPDDRMMEEQYLVPGFHVLSPEPYLRDPYRETICFPERQMGNWSFAMQFFEPYEVFVRDDLLVTTDGREIPRIGAFSERFFYPAVREADREWMTLAPVEIETMRGPIQVAHGDVLTLGLGLGYYAFHVSMKTDVRSLTVVERDPALIELFSRTLLPQFPGRDKIRIIEMDAYDYLGHRFPEQRFDTVFCDLWHDAGDGAAHYLKLKTYEKRYGTLFQYWIEGLLRQAVQYHDLSQR